MATPEGTFQIAGWAEETYAELEGGRKLTQADVKQTFTGDLGGRRIGAMADGLLRGRHR